MTEALAQMSTSVDLSAYRVAVAASELALRTGRVSAMNGSTIESRGPDVQVGELCRILPRVRDRTPAGWFDMKGATLAEVVGLGEGTVTLMPYGTGLGIAAGADVVAVGRQATVGVGTSLLGRVIDAFGHALDHMPEPVGLVDKALYGPPPGVMGRPRIDTPLQTGIRSIDGLLTVGVGQRMGIFAGSGVGKSTLLGMIARHVSADVNVIALIGERGREVREFVDEQLGPQGLRRSVVVVATSDQPAMARTRAAYAAVAIAEYFRDQGKQVLLTMDSLTRFAMARREIGLAAGEPPTARGYTPSVFAELPQLCERFGTSAQGGSITALLTVLVEGDDMNEPVADSVRSILDGHIVLSRQLAHQGQYPAIDVLRSASRLLPDLTTADERELIGDTLRHLALLERNRQLIEIGAYESGANPALDAALAVETPLRGWMQQQAGGESRATAIEKLRVALRGHASPPQPTNAKPVGDVRR